MNILGCTFLGADYSYSPTPTNVEGITEMRIQHGEYDTVGITKDSDMVELFDIDPIWNHNTILLATYDSNINAGNLDFTLENTSDIIIKRREKGTYKWITIMHKEIKKIEDFNILFWDYFFKNNTTYEYACVGLQKGAQSDYKIHEIKGQFMGQFICDKEHIYGTPFDIGSCNTSRVHYMTKKESLSHKYPSSYTNSNANYDTGSASGYFLKLDPANCTFYPEDSLDYRKEITNFLSDNKPKLLRHEDGRMWLINIDGEITDSMDGHYLHRITDFNWYESGDYNSEKDLYDSGLSDVPSNFWSSK